MKKILSNIFTAIFCVIFLISSLFFITQYHAHHPSALTYIGSVAEPFREKGVHISAKAYDAHDCKAYLNQDLTQLGFQPLQITIQNNTDKIYGLSTRGLETKFTEGKNVAGYVTRTAIPRAIGFKVAGFFFWPFIFPSAIDTMITLKSHQRMKKDFSIKSLKDREEWILQYSSIHRIIFLPGSQVPEEISLSLTEYQTGKQSSFLVQIDR